MSAHTSIRAAVGLSLALILVSACSESQPTSAERSTTPQPVTSTTARQPQKFRPDLTQQPRQLLGGEFLPGGRNLLVIHGWNGTPGDPCMGNLGHGIMDLKLYNRVVSYQYPSAVSIQENADWLSDQINLRYPGVKFDILAYSEGGLVARAAIERNAGGFGDRVEKLITIATPHLGVLDHVAFLGQYLNEARFANTPAIQDMRRGSGFLTTLNGPPGAGTTTYYTIAGRSVPGAGDDGAVSVASAHGEGVLELPDDHKATLNLVHSPGLGPRFTPCDDLVYDQLEKWLIPASQGSPSGIAIRFLNNIGKTRVGISEAGGGPYYKYEGLTCVVQAIAPGPHIVGLIQVESGQGLSRVDWTVSPVPNFVPYKVSPPVELDGHGRINVGGDTQWNSPVIYLRPEGVTTPVKWKLTVTATGLAGQVTASHGIRC
jgi:hypothetical protein